MEEWKKAVFKTLREEMYLSVRRMDAETITETEVELRKQFDFMHQLMGQPSPNVLDAAGQESGNTPLPEVIPTPPIETPESQEEHAEEVIEEEPQEEEKLRYEISLKSLADSFDEEVTADVYMMQRNLVGGGLLGASNPFVPESVVRELGLEDGDYVSRTYRDTNSKGRDLYDFALHKKGTPNTTRKEFKYAIVEAIPNSLTNNPDDKILVLSKNASGDPILDADGNPITLEIPEYQAERMHIQEGDVIDFAWYGDSIQKFSIPWRYNTEDVEAFVQTEEKRMLEYRKKQSETENAPEVEEELPELEKMLEEMRNNPEIPFRIREVKKGEEKLDLEGMNITIVGAYSFSDTIKKIIQDHGGVARIIPDNAHGTKFSSNIRRSDLVIIFIQEVSHDHAEKARASAKKFNVPFIAPSHFGRESLLRTLREQKNRS